MLERCFDLLDREGAGTASFAELMCSLYLACAGDIALKLQRELCMRCRNCRKH